MAEIANSGRYKIFGALVGGILLTSAAAWLPYMIEELEKLHLSHQVAMETAYGIFFLIAFIVSYIFVRELIKARLQINRCHDVLNTNVAFELHDKQLFHTMGKKQMLMAKRNEWPVSMVALYIKAMKGPKMAPPEISKNIKEIIVEELHSMLRGSDLAGSFAKNEYLILLPNCSLEHAKEIVQRILERLSSKEITLDDETYRLECKCGISSFGPGIADFKRLMARALEAVDRIRAKRGNVIEVY